MGQVAASQPAGHTVGGATGARAWASNQADPWASGWDRGVPSLLPLLRSPLSTAS